MTIFQFSISSKFVFAKLERVATITWWLETVHVACSMFRMEDEDTFEGNMSASADVTGGEVTSLKKRKTGSKGTPGPSGKMEHRHRAQSIIQSKALDELETEVFETGLYENADFARGSRIGVMVAEVFYSEFFYICI